MPILNEKEYKCDFCGKIFFFVRDETWSEDKANEEYISYFPGHAMKNRDIVCDDCWKIVGPNAKSS